MKWYKIFGSVSEASDTFGSYPAILITINGKRICLSRYQNKFFASDDACPHMAESLSKGTINYVGEIICPLHHYRFDLTTGKECSNRAPDLALYPVKTEKDGIYIGIDV